MFKETKYKLNEETKCNIEDIVKMMITYSKYFNYNLIQYDTHFNIIHSIKAFELF